MSVKLEDYQRALARFLEDISRSAEDILCVLLYGSMARGDLRVGESDIDLCVFIRREAFETRERFLSVLETILAAANNLSACGLPFERCHYYSEDELNAVDAKFVTIWGAERTSRIVWGRDIRRRIASSEAGRFIARTVFFEGRRILLPLAFYLQKERLDEQDCQAILNDLFVIRKAILQSTCNALGVWPDTSNALQALEALVPDVNVEVFKAIPALRGSAPDAINPEQLRQTLAEALILVEVLNERITEEMPFIIEDETKAGSTL